MKKLTVLLILIVTFFWFVPQQSHATSTGYFVVTAYYSPLPNQSSYIMWSYEAELRMNGMGIRWASGKLVFAGMLAAPQNYSFWTKIFIEWIGIWEVADRWGAIVSKWERWFKHDRIDVWMWHGEEGLQRAMYWGNRTVKWYITKRSAKTTINLKNHYAPAWATAGLKKVSNLYNMGIWMHSDAQTVQKLQELLKSTWMYNGAIDGKYKSIMGTIYRFQLKNGLVIDENTFWAWYWGKLTRWLFLKKYLNGTLDPSQVIVPEEKIIIPQETQEPQKVQETEVQQDDNTVVSKPEEVVTEKVEEAKPVNIFEKALTTKEEYIKLQETLKEIWLYKWEIDWKYASIRDIILEYQIWKLLVEDERSVWAGFYGPNTRATLKKDYDNFLLEKQKKLEKEKEIENRRLELEQRFKELEKLAEAAAEQRVGHIGILRKWDVSPAVRDLQVIMKDLGYFPHKDTAIYGEKTEQSVFNYQVEKGLLKTMSDTWAGVCWPVTKWQIKKDLTIDYLDDLLQENMITEEELIDWGILRF